MGKRYPPNALAYLTPAYTAAGKALFPTLKRASRARDRKRKRFMKPGSFRLEEALGYSNHGCHFQVLWLAFERPSNST